jgi:hypothetical protein
MAGSAGIQLLRLEQLPLGEDDRGLTVTGERTMTEVLLDRGEPLDRTAPLARKEKLQDLGVCPDERHRATRGAARRELESRDRIGIPHLLRQHPARAPRHLFRARNAPFTAEIGGQDGLPKKASYRAGPGSEAGREVRQPGGRGAHQGRLQAPIRPGQDESADRHRADAHGCLSEPARAEHSPAPAK